jgi:hypothetical protein
MYERQINYFFANLDNPGLQNNIFEAAELFEKVVAYRNKEGNENFNNNLGKKGK